MEGYGRKNDVCPQLLNLISKERSQEWISKSSDEEGGSTKLELNLGLGPPGGEWSNNTMNMSQSPWHINPKESSQNCSIIQKHSSEKKAFSSVAANTAVSHSTAQKRSAPAPVIGWPPIRSFRKNLASKSSSDSQNVGPTNEKKPIENSSQKGMFVKINMDCIPIGRKVDLKAYDSYEKLSSSVDQLFKGLLAAQRDRKDEGEESITGLLDGSGEYTLVYEDNEGDRMLVGDVPWSMFVSTVKRLRVLKSSELSMLRSESKHGKLSYKS